jgi:hypothetical protein
MPVTVDDVKVHLGLDLATTTDEAAMQQAVDGTNALAMLWRADVTLDEAGEPLPSWPANIDKGGIIFAAKVYGRRGSVAGVAGFTEIGLAYVARLDPDLKAFWELGEFQPPVVA